MVQYEYDKQGRLTRESYYENGRTAADSTVTYGYDNDGALATVTDSALGIAQTYYYDLHNRFVKYRESGSGYTHIAEYVYNDDNSLTHRFDTINGTAHRTYYTYDNQDRAATLKDGNIGQSYAYNGLNWITKKTLTHDTATVATSTYGYSEPGTSKTTGKVYSLSIRQSADP